MTASSHWISKDHGSDAVQAASQSTAAVHAIGVRGSQTKHHCKQAIMAAAALVDDRGNLLNGRQLRAMAPHKDCKSRKAYIGKVVGLRHSFDVGSSDVLCEVKEKQRRNSLVFSFYFCPGFIEDICLFVCKEYICVNKEIQHTSPLLVICLIGPDPIRNDVV